MARLTVKNVGPIREADFEVKKYTVFIGPQGSGKSTLAKLIAIGGDTRITATPWSGSADSLINSYTLSDFIKSHSAWIYKDTYFNISYDQSLRLDLTDEGQEFIEKYLPKFKEEFPFFSIITPLQRYIEFMQPRDPKLHQDGKSHTRSYNQMFYNNVFKVIASTNSLLIPTERHLFPLFSDAIWSLLNADINLPESVKSFGVQFEQARNTNNQLQISFLNVQYSREGGRDFVYYNADDAVPLASSASGYQAVIPLLVTVEHQRQTAQRRFIIEEPELNLYPTAQKDLIYNLVSGLDPEKTYQDAEWVFTTHSPYVLSSLNTLMLAYKVAQQSEENRAKVEAIIPARHWINPDDFTAYYVDEGTVRSIINPKTGLISDNELDDVSDALADEQQALLDIRRLTAHHA